MGHVRLTRVRLHAVAVGVVSDEGKIVATIYDEEEEQGGIEEGGGHSD